MPRLESAWSDRRYTGSQARLSSAETKRPLNSGLSFLRAVMRLTQAIVGDLFGNDFGREAARFCACEDLREHLRDRLDLP